MRPHVNLLNDPNYDPNRLLNAVLAKLNLKNDAALARTLGVAPPVLSKVRHRRLPVAAGLILQIHDATRFSINEIRGLMGVARVF
jgi:DNA-binding transcriptional regulator YdaS (Cro superfamily)